MRQIVDKLKCENGELPNDINTFSAAVDHVRSRSGRWDKTTDIKGYLRATMREAQVKAFFANDLVEDQLTPNADPYTWTKPNTFRQMLAVSYPHLVDSQGRPIIPSYIPPSKKLIRSTSPYFYYDGPTYFIFAGHGTTGTPLINIAYGEYISPFAYYGTLADRPATFDEETQTWSYKTATTDDEKQAARDLVTNWLLFNWFDLCVEGCLAKLYKNFADPRKAETFALFKSFLKDLQKGEARGSIAGEAG